MNRMIPEALLCWLQDSQEHCGMLYMMSVMHFWWIGNVMTKALAPCEGTLKRMSDGLWCIYRSALMRCSMTCFYCMCGRSVLQRGKGAIFPQVQTHAVVRSYWFLKAVHL